MQLLGGSSGKASSPSFPGSRCYTLALHRCACAGARSGPRPKRILRVIKTFDNKYAVRYFSQTFISMNSATGIAPAPSFAKSGTGALRRIQSSARYVFTPEEFARLTGRPVKGVAVKMALQRLARSGLTVLAGKHPVRWLIVPPEQTHFGAPPVEWWLHDFLKDLEPHYYVGLLSAARHWGSAHFALQRTQVFVSQPRRATVVGRLRIDYFCKNGLARTPTQTIRGGVAPWRVSTREATLLDLVRHQSAVGGLEAVARICKDLAPELKAAALEAALEGLGQAPAAQRLGFLLEQLGVSRAAKPVARWLSRQRLAWQPLDRDAGTESGAVFQSAPWRLTYAQAQLQMVRELR